MSIKKSENERRRAFQKKITSLDCSENLWFDILELAIAPEILSGLHVNVLEVVHLGQAIFSPHQHRSQLNLRPRTGGSSMFFTPLHNSLFKSENIFCTPFACSTSRNNFTSRSTPQMVHTLTRRRLHGDSTRIYHRYRTTRLHDQHELPATTRDTGFSTMGTAFHSDQHDGKLPQGTTGTPQEHEELHTRNRKAVDAMT